MTNWEGDERRSIPIHILNHVDERLGVHANKVEGLFSDHTKEEMGRYQEILELIDRNNEENRNRHEHLCRSFESYTSKTEQVYEALCGAFVKDPITGKPDFHGHANGHLSWIEERKEQKEFIAYIKKVVSAAIATALVSWMGILAWHGLLAGPK